MVKLTIEDNGKEYKYTIPNRYLEYHKEIRIFSNKTPFLMRNANGKWYVRYQDCNYCGLCCIKDKNNKHFETKELDGKTVCKWLIKDRIAKEGEVYLCTNSEAPFGCCYGAFKLDDYTTSLDECTVRFKELKVS